MATLVEIIKKTETFFKTNLGFHYVFDTQGASQVAREEIAAEFLHRLKGRENKTKARGGGGG